MKPYNIYVTVAYPPDTDTPGFAEENKCKVALASFWWSLVFTFLHHLTIRGSSTTHILNEAVERSLPLCRSHWRRD